MTSARVIAATAVLTVLAAAVAPEVAAIAPPLTPAPSAPQVGTATMQVIGGGAGVLGHLELCDGVVVTAMSLVTHSIHAPGEYSSGTPLMDNRSWRKSAARFKQLDRIARGNPEGTKESE